MGTSIIIGILVGLCIGLTLISVLCALLGFWSYSRVVGFEKSTHRIEYVDPATMMGGDTPENPDLMKDARKAFGFTDEEYDAM